MGVRRPLEVGQLRKVMVCALPGRAHQRLYAHELRCAAVRRRDVGRSRRSAITSTSSPKMRDRGIEVVEMANPLAETVAIPRSLQVDPRPPDRVAMKSAPGWSTRCGGLFSIRCSRARSRGDSRSVACRAYELTPRKRRGQGVDETRADAPGITEYLLPPLPNTSVHA